MKKTINIFLALLITLFTLPVGGNSVSAGEKVYDDIANGNYNIIAKAINKDTGGESGAAGFISEDALLSIKDGKVELTITIPPNDMAEIIGLQVEGIEPTDNGKNWTYALSELKSELAAQVQYKVPVLGMDHDVPFKFVLEGLDKLPKTELEPETPEQPEDNEDDNTGDTGADDESENNNDNDSTDGNNGSEDSESDNEKDQGDNDSEESGSDNEEDLEENASKDEGNLITDPDNTEEVFYVTDKTMIERYFDNPVTLLTKDGKRYIQINGNSANFITSLTINGKEVTWGEIDENNEYTFQFEVEGKLSDELDFGMVIDTGNFGPGRMEHNVSLSFGKEFNLNESINVSEYAKVSVNDIEITPPENLPKDVSFKVTSKTDEVKNNGDYSSLGMEIAGEVYDFNFENLKKNAGTFTLGLDYDEDKYSTEKYDIAIYYYNENSGIWEYQESKTKNGKVFADVTHFSMYGVFAKEKDIEEEVEEPVDNETPTTPIEVPSESEEIDYIILHKNGKDVSTADSFFVKPGTLFEKNGNKYVKLTINNGNLIKNLKSEFGKAIIINENNDGSIDVQLRVNDDLSDTLLEMSIEVPGVYTEDHKAIFSINLEELKEDPKGEPKKKPVPKPEPKPTENTQKPDKAYKIDYVIKHATKDEISAADEFFIKPGVLLEKDGERYLQITVKSWSLIDWLTYNGKNVDVINVNKKNDTALIQLKIDGNLTDEIKLNMHITVPGIYSKEHNARLILDPDSMELVDAEEFKIYSGSPGTPGTPGTPKSLISHKSPEKPTFGDNGDYNATDNGKNSKTGNPKTGDTSNVIALSLLLIASLVPLAIKARRRIV